jgi:hypothetical protein
LRSPAEASAAALAESNLKGREGAGREFLVALPNLGSATSRPGCSTLRGASSRRRSRLIAKSLERLFGHSGGTTCRRFSAAALRPASNFWGPFAVPNDRERRAGVEIDAMADITGRVV